MALSDICHCRTSANEPGTHYRQGYIPYAEPPDTHIIRASQGPPPRGDIKLENRQKDGLPEARNNLK